MSQDAELLTPKQQRAISVLLGSRVYSHAAKSSKISERTLYRWLRQPEFREALQAAQQQAENTERELVQVRLRRLMPDFLDRLEALFDSANESVQVAALRTFLGFRKQERDVEIERRLQALEAMALSQTHRNGVAR
jgi:hypothetical protein